ncbi:hypothetical protein FS749_002067 [Ceratobasidium sp. UAMH 11750]|nr:hypothetical protein FS749_002067 [Ceratobasidium sp. UAMH 11750]
MASETIIANSFVTTEAAYIHHESIDTLSQQEHLMLSFDGGTTRKHEWVYAVYVTISKTREVHLMEENEAFGASHAAEHVCSVIDKTLKEIGPERFASVVSDSDSNTRTARAPLESERSWTITLQDACHQLNNVARDIGQLAYFQPCIEKMKSIITHPTLPSSLLDTSPHSK